MENIGSIIKGAVVIAFVFYVGTRILSALP